MKKHKSQNLFSQYYFSMVNSLRHNSRETNQQEAIQVNKKFLAVLACTTAFFMIFIFNDALASQIQSKNFDSKYVQMHDQEQIEAMQREIQAMNGKIENLEHIIKTLQEKLTSTEAEKKEEKPDHSAQSAETQDKEKASSLNEANNQAHTKEATKGLEKQKYDIALAALKSNDIATASQKFAEFIEEYPKGQFLSNAYFWYGESFFKQKIYDKAALNFLKSYKTSPKGPKASEALFKLASSLKELKKTPDACSMLNKLDEEFPGRAAASIKKADDLKKQMKCK